MKVGLMISRLFAFAWIGLATLCLAGCSGPISLYHDIEGGAIAQKRQAPPGQDAPYPNLANVPPAAAIPAPGSAARIAATVTGGTPGILGPNPAALEGLALPDAPPPPPGIAEPSIASAPAPVMAAAPALPPPPQPPVTLPVGFVTGAALLPASEALAISALAGKRGDGFFIAGGFGDGSSMALAIARARRIADALTAAGVPASAIRLSASIPGSGGFVQLVYEGGA